MKTRARQAWMALTLVTVLTMTWALPAARADESDVAPPATETVAAPAADETPASEPSIAPESEAPATEEASAPAAEETSAPATDEAAASEPAVAPESEEPAVEEAPAADEASAPASEPTFTLETAAQPELTTDKPDYAPGEHVSIFGRFFSALADIVLTVFGDSETGSHYFESTSILKADDLGSFATGLLLDNMYRPFYTMVAKSLAGDILATSTFTDAPGAAGNLDQCSNGSGASPVPCTGSAWQNGNLNANQAHYVEGDSAPYRMVLTGLPTSGVNTLVIEYDIKHSSKHAIDFLTSFDRTETTANPCSGVSPCALSGTTAIPAPSSAASPVAGMPTAAFNALPASERAMSIYNGAIAGTGITYVSQGDLNAAQSETRVKIEFTASNSTVVFAWGGHIGSSLDWGAGQSAGGISGSPYHMRFIELNGKGGNQDRSLSAGAIAPPVPKGALSGVKFNDLNGNGIKDPSDVGLSGWTINLTGAATGSAVTDAGGNYAFADLADGSYIVCEVMQASWTQTYPASGASCPGGTRGHALVISGGAILSGNDFGNAQLGSITIDKVTNPSGDAQSFSFALTGASSGNAALTDASAPAVFASRPLGSYTVTETSVSGWTLSGVSCTGVTTTPVTGGVTFTLGAGQNPVCTFTNTKDAKLTVTKVVTNDDGGTLSASAFPLFVDGNSVTSGASNVLAAGAHAVSETQQPGYAMTSISGDCDAQGTVTLNPGDDKTCTITNDDIAPRLTVVKHVVNDDGGTLEVEDVALFIDGNAATSGVAQTLAVGAHTASETNPAGYAASAWGGDCDAQGNVSLAPGDVKICVITNDDIAPKLTLVKTVTNDDGGSLTVAEVPLFIDGNAATSGVPATLLAGAHVASETNAAGYAASAWGGDCAADGTVTLNPGDDKTCTITNDDIAPKLTLVKTVLNDDGGSLQVGDVALFIDGNAATSGVAATLAAGAHAASETNVSGYAASSWSGDCAADGSITLNPGDDKTCVITNDDIAPTLTLVKTVTNDDGGTLEVEDVALFIDGNSATSGVAATLAVGAHAASETNPTGYAASAWGGDCAADGSVSLAPGENKTCTITNDDIAPKLTLVKTVLNDDGGSLQVGDVALFVDGNSVASGAASTLLAGAHAASETNPTGYLASQWGGDCAADGSIVLNPGDDKTCTIVNDDIAPRLTLVKIVTNDDSGTLDAEDVALFVDGNSATTGVTAIFLAGSHQASETNPAGYAASSWSGDCAADGSVTLNPGDDKTCVITNDDIQPKLTLTKIVVNDDGGTMTVSDFALDVSGTPVLSGAQNGFAAGSYQASETNIAGYAASSWSGDCDAQGNVTLAVGDVKACVITNDDVPGEIHGMKFEDLDGDGIKDAGEPGLANWTINLSNGDSTVTDANGAYAFTGLDADSYTVTETQQAGWTQTTANPSAIDLGLAQVVTGVDFGNFRLGSVTGLKWHDADMSGLKDNGETNLAGWTVYVDANGNGALDLGELSAVTTLSGYTLTGLAAGTYSICEVGQSGWSQVYPANGACHSVTISTSGQTVAGIDFGNVNEREGTIGLWRNWNKHNKYSQTQINGWLAAIDASSGWLMAEAGYPATTTGMVNLINDATKYCSQFPDKIDCAKRKFLAQYMVNRLNVASGRKSLTSTYDLSSFGGAMAYLGISPSTNVSLSTYFAKVELKAATTPNRNQFMQMMSVSDTINNLGL